MAHHSILFVDNTHVLRLSGLQDEAGDPESDATVELIEFRGRRGEPVNLALPLPLGHVADGDYELPLPDTLGLIAGAWYEATIRAVSGSLVYQATELIRAAIRRE